MIMSSSIQCQSIETILALCNYNERHLVPVHFLPQPEVTDDARLFFVFETSANLCPDTVCFCREYLHGGGACVDRVQRPGRRCRDGG
jgi:hypothetical protein